MNINVKEGVKEILKAITPGVGTMATYIGWSLFWNSGQIEAGFKRRKS